MYNTPLCTMEKTYGQYRMRADFHEDRAHVQVCDMDNLRFPLMWAADMPKQAAHGALEIFEHIGYFDYVPTV